MNRSLFNLALSTAILAVAAVCFFTVCAKVQALQSGLAAVSTDLAVRSAAAADSRAFSEAAISADSKKVLADYFVDTAGVVAFLEGIQSVGTTTGARITVDSVERDSGDASRLVLSIRADGSFDSVMRTMGAIEYGPHALTLSNASLTAKQGATASTTAWTAAMIFGIETNDAFATNSAAQQEP